MLRSRALEIGWVFFCVANLAAMLLSPEQATVPFHLIWISLTLLYGLRVWPLPVTSAVLGGVLVTTTIALLPPVLTEHHWAELTEAPLMAAVFMVMVGYARRRETALARVRKSAEREREFLRDASHQLRTPITVARGHIEMILASGAPPQVRGDAEIVLDELGNLNRISDRLLLLAAAERQDFLRREEIDIEELLVHMLRRWSTAADRNWRLEADEVVVPADRERLEAALDALIENAVKATQPGHDITLASRVRDTAVILEVRDSGRGVDPEHLPHLFERFYHVTKDAGSGPRGTGLGLSIVRAVAEAHGGHVCAASTLGEGASFRLYLPTTIQDGSAGRMVAQGPQLAQSLA